MRGMVVAGSLFLALLCGEATAQSQPPAETPRGQTMVWDAQVELTRAGLYQGPQDGMMTMETQEAVEDFENMVGWPESGRVTPDLVVALKRYNLLVTEEPDS